VARGALTTESTPVDNLPGRQNPSETVFSALQAVRLKAAGGKGGQKYPGAAPGIPLHGYPEGGS